MKETIPSPMPTEGTTDYVYRNTLAACYGGATRFYSPFISPGHAGAGITKRDRYNILLENNIGLYPIPQLLTNNVEDFPFAAGILRDYGCTELNLNFDCPPGTVTAKKKGFDSLSECETLQWFFECVFEKLPSDMKLSIGTRPGAKGPVEFPAIPEVYNDSPFSKLIVHPRIQKELYRGTVCLDTLVFAADDTAVPLDYNNDLIDEVDIDRIWERLPLISHIMLGRRLPRDPMFAACYLRRLCGEEVPREEEEKWQHHAFHVVPPDGYGKSFLYENATLYRMKGVWDYLGLAFPEHERVVQELKKSKTLSEYGVRAGQLFTF